MKGVVILNIVLIFVLGFLTAVNIMPANYHNCDTQAAQEPTE